MKKINHNAIILIYGMVHYILFMYNALSLCEVLNMNNEVNINEIAKKITKEVIKDEIYDDGEINDYVLDYSLPLHDVILEQVRENIREKRQNRYVLLVEDVLNDYKKVMDLKYTIKYWYADSDPSVNDNRKDIPQDCDVWLQDLIKLYAKYGFRYEYNPVHKRNRCGNYEDMIRKLMIALEGLLINREKFILGLSLEEQCISLEKLHFSTYRPKPYIP